MTSITVEINESPRDAAEPQLVSVRHVGSFNHHYHQSSPVRLDDTSLVLYEREFQEVQIDEEVNTDALEVKNLATAASGHDDTTEFQKATPARGLKKVIQRVATFAPRNRSLKVTFYPETVDVTNNSNDSQSREGLSRKTSPSKPCYRRSWFICAVYIFLILLVVGAIVLIAYDRTIFKSTDAMEGQIFPTVDVVEGPMYREGAHDLTTAVTNVEDLITAEHSTRAPVNAIQDVGEKESPDHRSSASLAVSVAEAMMKSESPPSSTTKLPVSVATVPDAVVRNMTEMTSPAAMQSWFSIPGPLQRIFGSDNGQ